MAYEQASIITLEMLEESIRKAREYHPPSPIIVSQKQYDFWMERYGKSE